MYRILITTILTIIISVGTASAQTYIMDGTPITTCKGIFLDSGGSNGNYSPNENIITTICSDASSGTHISMAFSATDIAPNDQLCFYDGTDTNANQLSCSADFAGGPFFIQATAANPSGCITIEFISDELDPNGAGDGEGAGWSAILDCIPSCQTIQANLVASTPDVFPVDTGYIDICVGDLVSFEGAGVYPQDGIIYNHSDFTSDFFWDFGNGNTGVGPNVSHQFNEPGGYIVQLTIEDQFGCKNTNLISQRIRVSQAPTIDYGDAVSSVCIGDTVSLSAGINSSDTSNTFTLLPTGGSFQTGATLSDSLALPDGTGVAYSTSVSFSNFAPGQILTDVNDILGIFVNMEHEYLRDLEIKIIAPNGAEVILHDHPGPIGGEMFLGEPIEDENPPIPGLGYDYVWTPNGTQTWIEYANANPNVGTLPPGEYATFDPLSNLLGTPLNGEWTISIQDLWGIDNGYIFYWGIEFNSDLYPNIETFTPQFVDWGWLDQPIIEYSSSDSISAIPTSAGVGNFIFQVEDEFGCIWENNVLVEFLPETHPDCYNCNEIIEEFPDTTICTVDEIIIDAGGENIEFDVPFTSYTNYSIGNSNHPPSSPYNAIINVNSITPNTIVDPLTEINSVCLDFETNFLSDVGVFLQSPNGTVIELTTGNGGTSDFYTSTCFTPSATTPITSGTTPFTGDFQIEGDWNDLVGSDINGEWVLLVSDDSGLSSFGTLNWWSISFNSSLSTAFTWDPADDLDCATCQVVTYNGTDNTTLTVEAINSLGCVDTDTIEITIDEPVAAPLVNCDNDVAGTIILSWPQVGAYTNYLINVNNTGFVPANGGLSHSVTGLANGDLITAIVMVEGTGNECAILETTIECYNCTMTTSLISVSDPSCFGLCDGQAELFAVGGDTPYQYEFTDANGNLQTSLNPTVTGLCPGIQTVSVIDNAGCKESFNIELTEPADIVVSNSTVTDASCFGEADGSIAVEVTGGSGAMNYDWQNINTGISVDSFNLSADDYLLVLTDENGCTDSTSYNIGQPAEILISTLALDETLCFGSEDGTATMEVSGGNYPYTYSWSNNPSETDSIITSLAAGDHVFTIEDANACSESITINIGQPVAIDIQLVQTYQACFGQDDNIAEPIVTGGNWPYAFEWTSGITDSIGTLLADGINTLTVTDANGCVEEEDLQIDGLEEISFDVLENNPDCFDGDNGTIEVINVSGGFTAGTYQYIFNGNPPNSNSLLEDLEAEESIQVQIIDEQGCFSAVETLELDNPPALVVNLNTSDVACAGYTDGDAEVSFVNFGVQPFSYTWDIPSSGNASSVGNLSPGTYTVTVTDALGCIGTTSFDIGEPSGVSVNFDIVEPSCNGFDDGNLYTLPSGGAGAYTYEWSTTQTSQDLNNITSGDYELTITDGNNCESVFTASVSEPDPLDPGLAYTDVRCYGDNDGTISFNTSGGTAPYLYSINNNDFFGNPMLIGLEPDDYNVQLIDDNGCIVETTINITEPPALEMSFPMGNPIDLQLEDEIMLSVDVVNNQGNYTVTWLAPYEGTLDCVECLTPIASPLNTIDYFVTVVDEQGCDIEERLIINVIKNRVVLVPTGFSPNNDNNNDILRTHGKPGTTVRLFQVFDKWGELLYEASDFDINDNTMGWDGTFRGNNMPQGAYIWHLEVEYIDGLTDKFQGQTNLIR